MFSKIESKNEVPQSFLILSCFGWSGLMAQLEPWHFNHEYRRGEFIVTRSSIEFEGVCESYRISNDRNKNCPWQEVSCLCRFLSRTILGIPTHRCVCERERAYPVEMYFSLVPLSLRCSVGSRSHRDANKRHRCSIRGIYFSRRYECNMRSCID